MLWFVVGHRGKKERGRIIGSRQKRIVVQGEKSAFQKGDVLSPKKEMQKGGYKGV